MEQNQNFDKSQSETSVIKEEINSVSCDAGAGKLKQTKSKKIIDPNVVLVLVGLFAGVIISGSFGLDFFSENKSPRVLGESTEIFEESGKTWVAFDEPIMNVIAISDENCEACDYKEVAEMFKKNISPTISMNDVSFDSEEGKALLDTFGIKFIPAFIFDSNITEVDVYENIKGAFTEKNEQLFLDSLKAGIPVGRYLETLQIGENDASKGPKDAKVTIIEFSDFQCPYCLKGKEVVEEVVASYGDKVRLVFKHFPLQFHSEAQKAAEASECANEQGKFWEMHDFMFENQDKLMIPDLKKAASSFGLDVLMFNDCLDSGKYEGKINDDMKVGSEFGVSGTPAFFINDQFLSGARPVEDFKKIIDAELEK